MNCSRIPFVSALDRLSELLPIGPCIRLRSVVPRFQTEPLYEDCYEKIIVQQFSPTFLSMEFVHDDEDPNFPYRFTTDFDSPEAVLNSGPVKCVTLVLNRADGIPPEAIKCKQMHVDNVAPAVLPLLSCGAREVIFHCTTSPQTAVTLPAVVASLRPDVHSLLVPWRAFSECADIDQIEAPSNGKVRFNRFFLSFPHFETIIEWLRRNAHAMAHRDFCKEAFLSCNRLDSLDPMQEHNARMSASPYCPHQIDEVEHNRRLTLCIRSSRYVFNFNPQKPCRLCNRGS